MSTAFIYGRHAVLALLSAAPERIQILFVSTGSEKEFRPLAQKHNIRVEEMNRKLSQELEGAVHQGIVARVVTTGVVRDYAEFMNKLEPTASTALVLLNEITDPHNVGAIIRSAAAFGAAAVLLPAHNQAPITGVVAKASAGTVFTIPIVGIGNENQAILDLKERRYWIYGLDTEGKNVLSKEKFDAPAVFVIGSEGEGLRQKTREHCDILLRIPMHERAESLNASVSAGVVLSAWSTQHSEALK
ncbi:23S rRNA (guanosine(2251)-2'-O)-methyltransferase RlmB [Candidatus Kaiserbacteria bacterium]|nr:23S rRNA (guanosine(2251)-2'-O)-methyltransferase RlmB [Candidatus Kaiserbacteria bacterium]